MSNRQNLFTASLFEATLEANDTGILLIDLNREVVKYNSRFIQLWNIPQHLQKSDDEKLLAFFLDQLSNPKQFIEKVIDLYNHPLQESLDILQLKDGRALERLSSPIFLNDEPVARVWIFRDITETLNTRNQLNKEIGFRTAIIQTLPDLVWLKNPEGNYLACNTIFERFFGAKEQEIIGKTDYDFVDRELADSFRINDLETIKAGKARVNEELVTFADSGDKVSLETTKTPMYDKDGKLIGVLGIGHNVTRRKEIENYAQKNLEILEMIAVGSPTPKIYDQIALMYEARHPGMRCSMLELGDGVLLHGGAPSLPQAYCDAVHGLKIGPDVGSCGASTFTGKRVLVENIETDPKWAAIKGVALPHGMRCCWSEPIKNSSGVVLGAFGMYYDYPALPNDLESEDLKSAARLAGIVMERDHTQKRIREMAYTDELTGIANRAHFYQYIKDHTKLSKRNNADFGLLYIDLDDFKGINDTLGHDAGDQLLIEIATRLKFICRDIDFIARLGGDEFCIIVKDIDDEFSTGHVAKRCLQAVSKPIEILGRAITPACSIGIAHFPEDGIDISTLLKVADTSLYAAKEMGKNQFAFYKPELTQKAEYRFKVEQNLRQAIQQQQLTLVYQPQIKTCTNEIIGVEVLSRWHHPNLGTIAPTEFIPIAERIGIIKQHTVWLLKEACLQATRWKNAGLPQIRISVNISANLFLEKHFNNLIHNILKETGMPPNKLELEVTESVVQTGYENLAVFKELKALGVLIAIDDFGTGYSSFASLKQLEADNLKIDRYFIKDMLTDPKCGHLVTSMIEIGHNLEHGIIAEGVETVEQLNVLKKLGCEAIQGFLYSQPLEVEEVEQFLSAKIKNGISYWPNQAF